MQLALPLGGPPGGITGPPGGTNGPPRWQRALVTRDDGTIDDPRSEEAWRDWVSASGVRTWCSGQTLLDWLDLFGDANGFVRDELLPGYDERFDFGRSLMRLGLLFEEHVVSYLERRVPVTRIAGEGARSLEAAQATATALQRGDPAIARGVLRDPQARTYGRVDLLVRSDVLAAEWPEALAGDPEPLPWAECAAAHHRVVEIKYSTLHLLKDGALAASHRADMLQAWSYNRALARIQGFEPPAAYILGRGWQRDGKPVVPSGGSGVPSGRSGVPSGRSWVPSGRSGVPSGRSSERGDSAWDRLGRVPADRTIRGIPLADELAAYAAWTRRLRAHGADWRVLPSPSVDELWPDMGADGDAPWHEAKRRIAGELADLTLLWQVGTIARARAHAVGITRWDDARLGPELLGVPVPYRATLAAMLDVNRATGGAAVRPARIAAVGDGWRTPAACEAYVDFETVPNLRDDFAGFPKQGGQSLIFQIGCGLMVDGSWWMAQFTARALTVAAEAEMLDRWLAHLRALAAGAGVALADVRLFHWSAAETSMLVTAYDSARRRHPEREWPDLGWFDLLERVVRAEPVVVRGALGFGLKKVGKAMHALGLIETDWIDGVADGTGAMAGAWSTADEAEGTGAPLEDVDAMREVARYNEIDCRVMAEVLAHLRREH